MDTAKASSRAGSMAQQDRSTKLDSDPSQPRTPTRSTPSDDPAEPTSSKVTINLRTRHLDSIPSSPPSPTPSISNDRYISRESIESESDALSTVPANETPSSSPSIPGSPEVELVLNDDDSDFTPVTPSVAVIGQEVFPNPMDSFPYHTAHETLVHTVRRLTHFVHYGI